ncbi:MAG: hypothetical protein ACI4DS_00475 [Eubacterium sp.]
MKKFILFTLMIVIMFNISSCNRHTSDTSSDKVQSTQNGLDEFYQGLSSNYYYNEDKGLLLEVYYQFVALYKVDDANNIFSTDGMSIDGEMLFNGIFEADLNKSLILLTIGEADDVNEQNCYIWKDINMCGAFEFAFKATQNSNEGRYDNIVLEHNGETCEFDWLCSLN